MPAETETLCPKRRSFRLFTLTTFLETSGNRWQVTLNRSLLIRCYWLGEQLSPNILG